MKKPTPIWSWFWIILGILYFFLPLIATLEFSLKAQKGVLSLLAFERVLKDPNFLRSFGFSIQMAIFTILVSILLVVPTAYWVHLRMPKLRPLVEFVTLMPFVIPAIILVFGLIRVYSGQPFSMTNSEAGTVMLLVAAYSVLALPYMYRAVDAGLRAIDIHTLTEAAQSLGAGWGTILLQIIFPNLRVALLSGAFLTLATVMGEFTIASFLVGLRAFGPYMSLIGQNKAYEASALAILSFMMTWASIAVIQIISRGLPGSRSGQLAGAR